LNNNNNNNISRSNTPLLIRFHIKHNYKFYLNSIIIFFFYKKITSIKQNIFSVYKVYVRKLLN